MLNASGAGFRAHLDYNALNPAYSGEIDISPLHIGINANAPRWLVAHPTVVNMTIGHLPRRALTSIPLDPADEAG